MRTINVLATQPISADDRAKIEASDPEIRLIDAGGWFDGEIGETWTAFAAARYLPPGATGSGSREERDRLLAETEVIIGGWPFPLDLRARAPRLKWLHQRQAGASNLLGSDLWGGDVMVTTSRGVANSLPIAEYALAGILHFAMGFHRAAIDREAGAFDHRAYRPLLGPDKRRQLRMRYGRAGPGPEELITKSPQSSAALLNLPQRHWRRSVSLSEEKI